MSGARPAALGGSLLARKGTAVPAIPDESPLVLHLEEHRPEAEDEQQQATAGFGGFVNDRLRQASERIAKISTPVRWVVVVAAVAASIAAVWLSNSPGETLPGRADRTPEPAVAVAPQNQGLQLNLTSVPEPAPRQVDRADAPDPPAASVALPASAALAVSEISRDEKPAAEPDAVDGDAAPASVTVIPVNVPSSEIAPPIGDVDTAPEIPAPVAKSVSPVPVPKEKPELAAVPVGRYAVQLASITIEKRANEEAFRLQKYLGHLLGGREIKVEKAVVAGKGTTYRLRASGYQTNAEARAACAQVVQLKANCLAIRR